MRAFDLEPLKRKSQGKTVSEMFLSRLCEKTMLSMWCFPNPYTIKQTKKELCDVLIVFKNHIFLFSDKQAVFQENEPMEKAWNRWYRKTVLESARQLIGAERQIRKDPQNIYVDKDCRTKFPFSISISENTHFHRIIVARGSKHACQSFMGGGHGSLIVDSRIVGEEHFFKIKQDGTIEKESAIPFAVGFPLDKKTVFHIFDDFTTQIIMEELDSLTDLAYYLTEKEKLLEMGNGLWADGEQDILAHYLSRMENGRHIIMSEEEKRSGVLGDFDSFWDSYISGDQYQAKKRGDVISYIWDELIEKFYRNIVTEKADNITVDRYDQMNALFTPFAELMRIERRMIGQAILSGYEMAAHSLTEDKDDQLLTLTRTIISYERPDCYYVLLFVKWPKTYSLEHYREERREKLDFSMRLCKHRNPDAKQIIGLAFSNDRTKDSSEDMMLLNVSAWTEDDDRIIELMLRSGVRNNLGQRGLNTSSNEYSDQIQIQGTNFPWND